jgi:hypothetical protein
MRSAETPLDFRIDHGSHSVPKSLRHCYSKGINQQLFSQDYYIGKEIAFKAAPRYIADFRPGDFDSIKADNVIQGADLTLTGTLDFILEFTTHHGIEEIRHWYRSVLKSTRIAISSSYEDGHSACYNPFFCSLTSTVSLARAGEVNVSLLFITASSHPQPY